MTGAMKTARDLMTADVATLEADTTIGDAIALLTDLEIRHLPVVSDGVLVGVLSDRDFRQIDGLIAAGVSDGDPEEAREREDNALHAPVASLLGGMPQICAPEASADAVIDILVEQRIGAVVVVDAEGAVLGIISTVDVLRAARGRL